MAVSQAQIVDLLYKQAFGVTKTDTAQNKSPSNESIPSPALNRGDTAMAEWHRNVYNHYELDYDNILEKTGMDCTKWLVEQWMNGQPVVDVVVHSANAIGSGNIRL